MVLRTGTGKDPSPGRVLRDTSFAVPVRPTTYCSLSRRRRRDRQMIAAEDGSRSSICFGTVGPRKLQETEIGSVNWSSPIPGSWFFQGLADPKIRVVVPGGSRRPIPGRLRPGIGRREPPGTKRLSLPAVPGDKIIPGPERGTPGPGAGGEWHYGAI